MHLDSLKDAARNAFHGTSMDPERRGSQLLTSYENQLRGDLAGIPVESHAYYIDKYRSFMGSWLASESRCVSSFIAGPSNFPVRQQTKYRNWAESKHQAFDAWRERFKKGQERRERRAARLAGDPLEEMKEKLRKAREMQVHMVAVNKLHGKYLKKPSVLDTIPAGTFMFDGKDITESTLQRIRDYKPTYSWEVHPFVPYQVAYGNKDIKRYQARVNELERKEVLAMTAKEKRTNFTGGYILENYQEDRLQIYHDAKPAREAIDHLKKEAFKWAPSMKCWQRQLTNAARYAAFRVTGVDLFARTV